ncbi:12861_t:CDS:10 [Dentiscutata erythropus]|uniref:Prolyl endopeptidase n=1 Tax=Dentiscutata erythropus TaxID=1348616 RepID=A0A9N9BVQ4_9GLOM|nr:12861_t:CDS:10 [Dentiscutata erythropus]
MSLTWNYPVIRRDESIVEELHGIKVADPYRWLENPDSEETKPNTFEADGTVALNTYSFSKYGKYFAYGISKSGSDWVTIHVRTTENDEQNKLPLGDVVEWVKFSSIEWTHDEAGFFYNRYPEPEKSDDKGTETDTNLNAMLYYHKLGTSQSDDILVYKDPSNPEYMYETSISTDGRYVVLKIDKDCAPVNKLWILDLKKTNHQIIENCDFLKIVDNFDAQFDYITNDETTFYFKTNLKAPRYKIVKYDLNRPDDGFTEIIKEHPTDVLCFATPIAETNLVITYMHDVKELISIHNLSTGKHIKDLDVPIGSIDSIKGRREDTEFFFKFISFLNPGVIYRYDFTKEKLSEYRATEVYGFNSNLFETKQVFVESKDKTKIPVFIILPKNITYNGNNPTLLYGYGGFSISITPSFSTSWLNFIQHYNGVVAVANLRGGGEYGEEWHNLGMLHNKQNVFDDFQSVAKWLVDNKITCPEKLAINGGSNGGLLVGACINQAPELFGAAVADVGVMDMLRFHKFTIGHAWRSDYGDPDKKEDFEYIYKYSPLHNVQSIKPYPSVLLTTSDHDDRVVPLHSYKLIAQLQYVAKKNPNPLMIRIETKAGHGSGKPTKKRIDEATDKYSFIALSLDAKWVD